MPEPQKFTDGRGAEMSIEGTCLNIKGYGDDVDYDIAKIERCAAVFMDVYFDDPWRVEFGLPHGISVFMGRFSTAIEASALVRAILLAMERARA